MLRIDGLNMGSIVYNRAPERYDQTKDTVISLPIGPLQAFGLYGGAEYLNSLLTKTEIAIKICA